MRRLLVVLALCGGCGSQPATQGDLGGVGGGEGDLATSNTGDDLSPSVDLAPVAADLSSAAPDLGGATIDMTGAPEADLAAASDLSTLPAVDLAPPVDLLLSSDLASPSLPPLSSCNSDGDCASHLCKPALAGTKICVVPCATQGECGALANTFCEPTTAGAATGYCVPRSPMHCAACALDSDCGGLADRCLQAPGDTAAACHIDCSLGGISACPVDYTCSSVTDGATSRKLCLPTAGKCLDAFGGFCDRVPGPQMCARSNQAGACTGLRTCLAGSQRFSSCDALTPQLKGCGMTDPPGCFEQTDPNAMSSAANCGACGNACPGLGLATDDATCVAPATRTCGFTCRGDNYDVDGDAANGCEKHPAAAVGHTLATATSLGSQSCSDSVIGIFKGELDSDARVHTPAVEGFNATVGAAPDVRSILAPGGTCFDNYSVTITTTGGSPTVCYRVTLKTDLLTASVDVSGNGTANMNDQTLGDYTDGATLYFTVEKTCSLPVRESVQYTVSFHL